jgi:hypothetical protein
MMIAETEAGTFFNRSPGGNGILAIMAVNPLHRIARLERKYTREHFVKGNAE